MDGHFVPNLTIGPPVVASLRKVTRVPLDCHLMIERPDEFISAFAQAGVNWIWSIKKPVSISIARSV
jgi:ribulose-phosphate 3-epimerase